MNTNDERTAAPVDDVAYEGQLSRHARRGCLYLVYLLVAAILISGLFFAVAMFWDSRGQDEPDEQDPIEMRF